MHVSRMDGLDLTGKSRREQGQLPIHSTCIPLVMIHHATPCCDRIPAARCPIVPSVSRTR
jgi:hypothetical protein